MGERSKTYFVADVHLGLKSADPKEREDRFIGFLKGIGQDARALYLLGDIWDFWYEYRDVIPKTGFRVLAELTHLMDEGVEIYFVEGNHDMWTFSFFESLGIRKLAQPCFLTIDGATFCIGHGDGIGGTEPGYKLMLDIFHNRLARKLFSTLHPWIAFRFGLGWSGTNRRKHSPYHFRGPGEPLYEFAVSTLKERKVDFFVFGHFHDHVDMQLPGGSRLIMVKDWVEGGQPHAVLSSDGTLTVIQE